MPKVANKSYPYTRKGMAAAREAARKKGWKVAKARKPKSRKA